MCIRDRVGWVVSDDVAALQALEKAKHYTSICNSAPSELLATVCLRNGQQIMDRNRAICATNDAVVTDFMTEHDELFDYQSPDGGCVTFPRYLGADGVEEFCRRAVEESGVFLLPASIYTSGLSEVPADRFRIGIGRRNVPQALDALRAHLQS